MSNRYCKTKGCWNPVPPRVRHCNSCKRKRAQDAAKTKRASMTRQQKADLKLKRLRERLATWERKARIAAKRVKIVGRRLKAAERRYAWDNFIGWDKRVPMPRSKGGALPTTEQIESAQTTATILAGVQFMTGSRREPRAGARS